MNLSDLKESKFLKKEDVEPAVLVTISGVSQKNVAMEGAEQNLKAVLHFTEFDKPLVLNSTNGQIIARITGCDTEIETKWVGHKVVLYNDPNVTFQGQLVGGIRVRAPKQNAVKVPTKPIASEPPEDTLPF